jgi:hypothetical protein
MHALWHISSAQVLLPQFQNLLLTNKTVAHVFIDDVCLFVFVFVGSYKCDIKYTKSSAQNVFLSTVQHDLIIQFLLLFGGQRFARTTVRLTAFILFS